MARPARATAPGIPHTALLSASWANTAPPAATSASAPIAPSRPMPERITASAAPAQAWARLSSIGSTEGTQPLGAGSVPIRAISRSPWRRTMRWPCPGAMTIRPAVMARPSRAISAGRPQAVSTCRANTGMNEAGRCWVMRIGTSQAAPMRRSNCASAWMPPVEAPIPSTCGRQPGRARAGRGKCAGIAPASGPGAGAAGSPPASAASSPRGAPSARILRNSCPR
ncbi:MAG: hypothetical protein KatS3mg120_1188 [Erythrobacter sp.]|nr:MAG: hypothetical protein KatS3mg120_1188 [Erythrobacter sp.]